MEIEWINIHGEFRTLVFKVWSVDQRLLHPPLETQGSGPVPGLLNPNLYFQDPEGVHIHARSTGWKQHLEGGKCSVTVGCDECFIITSIPQHTTGQESETQTR